MSWGAFDMVKFWYYFRVFVASVCVFGAFVVWHIDGAMWFFVGAILAVCAILASVSLSKEDEDRDNPII